jgi:hypothetical protein
MRKGDDLTTFRSAESRENPEPNLRIAKGLLRPVAGNLHLYHYYALLPHLQLDLPCSFLFWSFLTDFCTHFSVPYYMLRALPICTVMECAY